MYNIYIGLAPFIKRSAAYTAWSGHFSPRRAKKLLTTNKLLAVPLGMLLSRVAMFAAPLGMLLSKVAMFAGPLGIVYKMLTSAQQILVLSTNKLLAVPLGMLRSKKPCWQYP